MLSGPNLVTSVHTRIFALAGYYTGYDRLQHVIAAAEDGYVYQVNWDPSKLAPGYPPVDRLWHFDNIATIAGFFSPDDNYHHVVATTDDGKLHELWFKPGESPHKTDLPYDISGFHPSNGVTITIPPTDSQIASISGFLSKDENPNTRHIIVARNDTGQIYDIAYPDENHVGPNYVRTSFNEPVQNVTAFFSSDTNHRHIVVLTRANFLKDLAYPTYYVSGGNTRSTQLTSSALANVADITSFYSAHDQLRHVVYTLYPGWMSSPERSRLEFELGPGGDHDIPYHFALPASLPQVLAWMRLLARVHCGEVQP